MTMELIPMEYRIFITVQLPTEPDKERRSVPGDELPLVPSTKCIEVLNGFEEFETIPYYWGVHATLFRKSVQGWLIEVLELDVPDGEDLSPAEILVGPLSVTDDPVEMVVFRAKEVPLQGTSSDEPWPFDLILGYALGLANKFAGSLNGKVIFI